jgi:uncharacterized membrane protein YkoI
MKMLWIAMAVGTICFADQKIKLEDMPAAVQAAVKEQSKGATIKGFSKEVENGKTSYEAEMTVNGHAKDVSFDATGKVVSVEEETSIETIPAPTRDAIQKAVGTGKLQKVETVTENGKTFYEAAIKTGAKSKEVKFDAAGKTLK